MTLAEFLLARIAEDENVATQAKGRNGADWTASHLDAGAWRIEGSKDIGANPRAYNGDRELWDDETALGMHPETAAHIVRHDPARVLAECEAKRRIVEYAQEWRAAFNADRVGFDRMDALLTSTHMLELLAAPYSDHPDYREEWRHSA